jgi:hypothetical protein
LLLIISGDGSCEVIDDAANRLTLSVGEEQYVTAWAYLASDPTTPIYINTQVFWTSTDYSTVWMDPLQRNSNVFGRAPGVAHITAALNGYTGSATVEVV